MGLPGRLGRCRREPQQGEFVGALDRLDRDGRTALMMAVESGIESLVDQLVSAGANVTMRCAVHLRLG